MFDVQGLMFEVERWS